MKRLATCDEESFVALISICPKSSEMDDEQKQESHQIPGNPNPYSSREFQEISQGLEEEESSCKKRRLSVDQVKALEKNFEVENKLEPDRKIKLAQVLGLQPRQVAVWFQNRRARWKTKQLERDYSVLKASHDALTHKFQSLQIENESLIIQIEEMKAKLKEDGSVSGVKEEPILMSVEGCSKVLEEVSKCAAISGDFTKDGSPDSDSSAIVNEENGNVTKLEGISSYGVSELCSTQLVKIEEQDLFGEEESCSTLFRDDQAPCLNWYCSDSWN